jgi:activator of HSP90 ATPase
MYYKMTRAIQQSIVLKATPEELFETFLDSKKHSAATGAPAKASRRTNGSFTAFGGQIHGRNLAIVPGKMIVQSWRASHWKDEDLDSILVLRFSKAPGGGRIDLVHVNVPAHDHKGVTQGWPKYYWKPWKAYLAERNR